MTGPVQSHDPANNLDQSNHGYQSEAKIRSARFRRGREASWQKLETILNKLEKKGLTALTDKEAIELPILYQAELSSLAVARSTVLDRNLISYLEVLSLRAYLAVYGPRASLWEMALKFLKEGLPLSVWALRYYILVSFSIFLLSVISGFLAVSIEPGTYDYFMDPSTAGGRNFSSSPEELSDTIFNNWRGLEDALLHFANFLFRNNTNVALLCFGLGFFLGVPTVLLLISNGLALGAIIGLFFEKGLGIEFLGWLSIHGVTELSAIVLAGAAGLNLGETVIRPGQGTRFENLSKKGHDVATVMIGVVIMLLLAGILEGCFRQLIDDTLIRLTIALVTGLFWGWYYLRGYKLKKDELPQPK
jgi:uncharacterized membrane protein SpoIIM required for sporulation